MDNLTRDVLEAQRLGYGCHYGNYKEDHPHTRPVPADVAVTAEDVRRSEPERVLRVCRHCGKEFVRRTNLLNFCSEICKKTHSAELNLEAKRRAGQKKVPRICEFCGDSFLPTHGLQRFCCISCSQGPRRRQKESRVCLACGKVFHVTKAHQKYCSRECASKRYAKKTGPVIEKEAMEK